MKQNEKLLIEYRVFDDRVPLMVVDNWNGTEDQAELIIAWYIGKHPAYTRYDLDWSVVESASFATTPEEIGAN